MAEIKKKENPRNKFAGGSVTDEAILNARSKGNKVFGSKETTLEKRKRFCLSQGGKWDAENNRCISVAEQEAQALKTRQEGGKELVGAIEPAQEPVENVQTNIPEGFTSKTSFKEAQEMGLTNVEFAKAKSQIFEENKPTQAKILGAAGSVGLAGVAGVGGIALASGLAPAVASFFARAAPAVATNAARGSRALGTNPRALGTNPRAVQAVLTAPSKLASTNNLLKVSIGAAGTLFGLGQAKAVGSEVLFGKAKKIKSEASLVGDVLTKIPETSSHGFKVDEETGTITEYTQLMALKDVQEVKQTLLDARERLQQWSIGNEYLKFKHDYDLTVEEVEKQITECGAAESKLFEQYAAPSEKAIAVKEFWEGVDLE